MKEPLETLQIKKKIKSAFEKDRFQIRQKRGKLVTQSEFLAMLIKSWRGQTQEEKEK